jgi:hypothetical protein
LAREAEGCREHVVGPYQVFQFQVHRAGLVRSHAIPSNLRIAREMLAAVGDDPMVLEVDDDVMPRPLPPGMWDALDRFGEWCLSHEDWGPRDMETWSEPPAHGWRLQAEQDNAIWTLHLAADDAVSAPLVFAMRRAHADAQLAEASVCELEELELRTVLRVAFDDDRRCALVCAVDARSAYAHITYGDASRSDVPLTRANEAWLSAVIESVRAGRIVRDTITLAGLRLATVTRVDIHGVPDTHVAGWPFAERLPRVRTTRRTFEPWRSPE